MPRLATLYPPHIHALLERLEEYFLVQTSGVLVIDSLISTPLAFKVEYSQANSRAFVLVCPT